MARFAILDKDNVVFNIADWDPGTPWEPPGRIVQIPDDALVATGWRWNGSELAPPKPPEAPAEPDADAEAPRDLG